MQTLEMEAVRLAGYGASDTIGSGPVQPSLTTRRTALLVAAGGAVGGMLRFLLTLIAPAVTTPTLVEMPWATFSVNVLGCLALGSLTGVLERRTGPAWVRPLLATGLCGGFTTMSAVVLDGSAMLGAGFPVRAIIYAMLTTVVCIAAVVAGILGGHRLAHRLPLAAVAESAPEAPARDEVPPEDVTADTHGTTGGDDPADTHGPAGGDDLDDAHGTAGRDDPEEQA